ncbi:MAG: hypothetical protein IPJ41_09970 [Phycisphaerales bacterium]|nr:hypothetical protein [Phycisphaerales bacterium]
MVRRKADCYCGTASFLTLILAGLVGFVVAGPAIFVPLFARRPQQRAPRGCDWCGYDRAGLASAAPCPECGRTTETEAS